MRDKYTFSLWNIINMQRTLLFLGQGGCVCQVIEVSVENSKYSLFLTSLVFGGGCFNLVFSNAIAAAACWAFLIEGPEALYSSTSPNLRQTVNVFLWAGPDSSVNLYWCWILLYLASSFIKHIGVFSENEKYFWSVNLKKKKWNMLRENTHLWVV